MNKPSFVPKGSIVFDYPRLRAMSTVFGKLNRLRRSFSFRTSAANDELSKQSLNCQAAYMIAQYAENAGKKIEWSNFPKVAIYRSFAKVYVYFDTPGHIMNEMCAPRQIPKSVFRDAIKKKIVEATDEEFADFICSAAGTYEERIYKAARKITNLVEFHENKFLLQEDFYCSKIQEIMRELEQLSDIPGVSEISDVNGEIFRILIKLASQRHQNRWATNFYTTECSVLGHLFETAVFAYAMSLEMNPEDEETATEMFFAGVFHDIPEAWTTDIPGPSKEVELPEQGITFRTVIKEFEEAMLKKHLYPHMPGFLETKLRYIMSVDENPKTRPLIKGADYLSAVAECYRQYVGGSNDIYFLEAIDRHGLQIITNEILVTPNCKMVFNYYRDFAVAVTSHLPK